MAIDFPNSPSVDQEHVAADRTWVWDGTTWKAQTAPETTATPEELNQLDGITSNVQQQLNNKLDEVNGAVTTAATGSNVVRNITLSTSAPTGGSDGDVWLVYTA